MEAAAAGMEEGVETIAADMEEGVETMEAASNNNTAVAGAEQVAGDRVVALRPTREAIQAGVEAVRMRLK
jgi:hypothetical protein